jgi:hypothetical protein
MVKKINEKLFYNNIEINLEDLVKGIFYPDLPCSYFFINNNIEIKTRLCSVTNLLSLGKNITNNMRSQIEESHNGRFSINHSMSDHPDKFNLDIRDAIISKCIILLYLFLTTSDYSLLGYILHIIQDSFSPVHSYRQELTENQEKEKKTIKEKTIIDIIQNFKAIKIITPQINFSIINHLTVSDLVYHVIDDKNNVKVILDLVKKTKRTSNENVDLIIFINKIIELLLNKCPNSNSRKLVLNILLGYTDGKIKKSIISNPFAEERVSINKINPSLILNDMIDENKIESLKNNVLVGPFVYDDLSHNLRRVYKIIMNSLFNDDVLSRIELLSSKKILQKGGTKLKYVKSFLFYPHQDQDKHAVKDCGYVQNKLYKENLDQCISDTKYILNFCLNAHQIFMTNKNDDSLLLKYITQLYNYLYFNTFYMSSEDLNSKVSTINNDKHVINKTDSNFLKCSAELITYVALNFKLKQKKILDDMVNINDKFK